MKMFFNILLYVLFASTHFTMTYGNTNRHVIYWNKHMSPELATDNFVLNVQMGEFMDVICPQHSLMGITNGPRKITTFDLYNVTKEDFSQCRTGGRKNFIFACDRPERENKLTIKFQTISPSPLGFRFQYCQDYYFVATTRGRRTQPGCHRDVTRLRISVGCKETTTKTSTTTATTATTTTTRQPESTSNSLLDTLHEATGRKHRVTEDDNTNSIHIPKLVNLSPNDERFDEAENPQLQAYSDDHIKEDRPSSSFSVRVLSVRMLLLTASLILYLIVIP